MNSHRLLFQMATAVLLCWLPDFSYSQGHEIDSLEQLAASSTDTLRIDALIQLGRRLRATDPARSIEVFAAAREEARAGGHLRRQIRAINSLGISHGMQGAYPEAMSQFNTALQLHTAAGNLLGMAESYSNLGIIYKYIGDYAHSHDLYLQALQLYDSLHDQSGRASCFHNIGVLYDLMEEPEKSLDFYRQALEIQETLQNEADRSLLLHNIGLIYEKQEKYQEALDYLFESIEISRSLNDQVRVAGALNSIGHVYLSSGAYESAGNYLLQSLEKSRELGLKDRMANSLHNLSKVYLRQNASGKALQLAEENLLLSNELGSFSLLRQAHELLAEAQAQNGRYQQAYEHSRLAAQFQDSLFSQNKTQSFHQWQTRLDVYEKDRQLNEQQMQIEWLGTRRRLDRQLQWALGLALLMAGTGAWLFFQKYKLRQQTNRVLQEKNQRIETQKAEIEQINRELEKRMLRAQINPHFIFNSLSSIQHFITANDRPSALKYLSKFSSLLRQVLEGSISSNVVLAEEVKLLRIYLDLEALRFDQGFSYEIALDPELDPYTAEVPVLLLQPYVENAILHGLIPKDGDRKLQISFSDQNGYISCRIKDNGIGRAAAARLKAQKTGARPSRGMEVTRKRLEVLNKNRDTQTLVSFHDHYHPDGTAAGTEVIVQIPKP